MAKKTRPRAKAGGDRPPKVKAWAMVLASALAHPAVGRDGKLFFKARIPPILAGPSVRVQILKPIPMKGRLVESDKLCFAESNVLTLEDLLLIALYIVRHS
jgi:hypothetical protein